MRSIDTALMPRRTASSGSEVIADDKSIVCGRLTSVTAAHWLFWQLTCVVISLEPEVGSCICTVAHGSGIWPAVQATAGRVAVRSLVMPWALKFCGSNE
jgi:hypothetical protein